MRSLGFYENIIAQVGCNCKGYNAESEKLRESNTKTVDSPFVGLNSHGKSGMISPR